MRNTRRWSLGQTAPGGVYSPDLDYKKGYTLQFVNKKVGM
jgi:hypothetical protein